MPTASKPVPRVTAAGMVESTLGCKWSLTVLGLVRNGVVRPGAMEHAVPGLTTKVLNERLRKLVGFGILRRTAYPELPPRVEYTLTRFGQRFLRLLDDIDRLQEELDSPPLGPVPPPAPPVAATPPSHRRPA